jgi:hypothetical protein
VGRFALLVCLVLVGCDGSVSPRGGDGSAPVEDGGELPDGGSVQDAGALPDGGTDAGPPPPSGPILYPAGSRHSPITAELAARLGAAAAADPSLEDDRFSKVGDSITVSTSFLHCFAAGTVDLDGRPLDATLDHFRSGDVGGTTPFDRTSLAATVGWSANAARLASRP